MGQRENLRRVARSFKISVPRKDHNSPYLTSGKISEAFVEKVSALRAWEAVRNRENSSNVSAAPVFPAPRAEETVMLQSLLETVTLNRTKQIRKALPQNAL